MSAEIKVHFIDKMGKDLTVVNAARISFANESAEFSEKDQKLVDYLAKHEHLSPFEHCTLTVMVECPLYIRSQIHRHRTFAYNEVSRRYTADGLEFYLPPMDDIRVQSKNNKQASEGAIDEATAQKALARMEYVVMVASQVFDDLIGMGVSREQARGILPQCLMTKFYMTGNLRNFAHFVRLRVDNHAQKEAQYVGQQVKNIMLEHFPNAAASLFAHSAKVG
jgi:thymidylate synthase (FAD)